MEVKIVEIWTITHSINKILYIVIGDRLALLKVFVFLIVQLLPEI